MWIIGWATIAVMVVTLVVLVAGLGVVVMLLVRSAKAKRAWAGESLVLTAEQKAALEDPASPDVSPHLEESTTDALAIAQVQRNYLGNNQGSGLGPM